MILRIIYDVESRIGGRIGYDGCGQVAGPERAWEMRRYDFRCDDCEQAFDVERPVEQAGEPADCPFCGKPARRVYNAPKFLFKPDPNDVRPVWHNHGAFGHAHPPRRGYHPPGVEDH